MKSFKPCNLCSIITGQTEDSSETRALLLAEFLLFTTTKTHHVYLSLFTATAAFSLLTTPPTSESSLNWYWFWLTGTKSYSLGSVAQMQPVLQPSLGCRKPLFSKIPEAHWIQGWDFPHCCFWYMTNEPGTSTWIIWPMYRLSKTIFISWAVALVFCHQLVPLRNTLLFFF